MGDTSRLERGWECRELGCDQVMDAGKVAIEVAIGVLRWVCPLLLAAAVAVLAHWVPQLFRESAAQDNTILCLLVYIVPCISGCDMSQVVRQKGLLLPMCKKREAQSRQSHEDRAVWM